jgi:(p)ppGpp synthase/HD superfamily hydrolase
VNPRTREELDTMVCTAPGCGCGGELFLRAKCHPLEPLDVSYVDGVVRVACRKCKKPVVHIAVASAAAAEQAEAAELEIAERIARLAHEGQTEESTGDPYIRHIERVVALVDGDDRAKAIAWLHDVVEDNPLWSLARLEREGISPRVILAVDLLTRWPTANRGDGTHCRQDYAAYIRRIRNSGDLFAVAVKIADLKDHLRPNCPERLRPRYERALADLGGQA